MKNLRNLTFWMTFLMLGGLSAVYAWQGQQKASAEEAQEKPDAVEIEQVTENHPAALALVRNAREQLFERSSAQADMSQVVLLGDYRFHATGKYVSESGFRYRLEYRVELGELEGRFLEVCDGQILHTRRQISNRKQAALPTDIPDIELTRRDIQKIIRAARENRQSSDAVRAAEIGIGGLPAVLASLERSLIFDALREETIQGQEYYVVQGRWNPDHLNGLLSGLGGIANQIAGWVPDLVRVYFSKETLFPEKFLYLKLASEEPKTYQPMVTIEYSNVQLDQPIVGRPFEYAAPVGVEARDETELFLQTISQAVAPATPAVPEAGN